MWSPEDSIGEPQGLRDRRTRVCLFVNAYLLRLCKPRIRHVCIALRQGVVFGCLHVTTFCSMLLSLFTHGKMSNVMCVWQTFMESVWFWQQCMCLKQMQCKSRWMAVKCSGDWSANACWNHWNTCIGAHRHVLTSISFLCRRRMKNYALHLILTAY